MPYQNAGFYPSDGQMTVDENAAGTKQAALQAQTPTAAAKAKEDNHHGGLQPTHHPPNHEMT